MKKLLLLPAFLLASSAFATVTAYSPPVGGMTTLGAASTDNFVSVALVNNAAWVGSVASVSGSDISVSGAPGWGANAFASGTYYYARMLGGAQKGHYFSILANGTGDVTVDNAGLDLSVINSGDRMEIAPYWTLGTLYPAGNAGLSYIASASPAVRQTELLFFDATSTGINRSASATYYFRNGAWRQIGASASTSFDNTIIYPDAFFIQRNKLTATTLVYTGRVQPSSVGTVLQAVAATQNDNYVALAFPINVTLNASGLAAVFTPTVSVGSLKGQLLWFDPAGTGNNRSASATYYYRNGAWRKFGASASADFGSDVLTAGGGFIIRKVANSTTVPWVFDTGF